jgi:hypothetical protein
LKGNFNENSDFKGMSPDFHAISTSKHSFVWMINFICEINILGILL